MCIQSKIPRKKANSKMDLTKAIFYDSSLNLFLWITCVFICCGSTQHNVHRTDALKRIDQTAVQFQHERVHREITGSDSQSRCERNETVFQSGKWNFCYYDYACLKIFSDCCPDYERECGRQEFHAPKTSTMSWKCVQWKWLTVWSAALEGVVGAWMVYKCPPNTTSDELRAKCEKASEKFSYPVEDFIPVVGAISLTFRNKYCALCNGMENYTAWNVGVFTHVVPPEDYDLDSRLRFILQNGGYIDHISPGEGQPRRYCYGRNYMDNCSSTNDTSYKDCVEGPVEVVTSRNYLYFKNIACGVCNGYPGLTGWLMAARLSRKPEGFSIVFKLTNAGSTTAVVSKKCPSGTVYDTNMKFCREGYIIASSTGQQTNEFLILLWLRQPRGEINSKLETDLISALASQFSLQAKQISRITFHKQNAANIFIVCTFRLTLTPFQSLIMDNQHTTDLNITRENSAFLELLNFTQNFTVTWKNYSFHVVSVISKRLSCYGGKKLQSHEYNIVNETGELVVKTGPGEVFSLNDYALLTEDGNNTLCRKLVLTDCREGAYVPLVPNEYVIFPNLSVYYNATNIVFNFGEYLINERLSQRNNNILNDTQNSRNSTIAVCLPYKNTFNKTETTYSTNTTSYGLRILTSIGLSISIICLAFLLITYGLFQELRTVPGLNLMNLSVSMCLSQVIWLIGTAHYQGTIVCKAFAILEHYLIQVTFLAMSVISYHTCHVFSQPFVGRTANTSWRRFLKYSAFLWLTPAVFVAVCVTLDKTEVFLVDYGMNCWLGTANAKLYLFLLPLAVLLLYNIYKFIKIAVSLSRHAKDREILKRKEGKQNLLICTKLATLVGFPWLFAFIGVLFPDVEAFEYLFVVFVCLQGLYVGMAFLFNKKILKLYKDRLNMGSQTE